MMPMPTLRESQLVSPDSKTLPLLGAALRCEARGGLARVAFEQRFANPHAEALHVTYTFALPADAAVSGFRFRVADKIIEGEIDKKANARERFEEALLAGRTAALLDQERTSLFTQEIGNIPPGAEVVCEIVLDQKLRWLDDSKQGSWEWRFPLAAAPRYLGVAGRVADSGKISLDVAETLPIRASLAMDVGDAIADNRSPESPTHPLSCIAGASGFHVELGAGNAAPLDRDVVVRWPVSTGKIGVSCAAAGARDSGVTDAHALVTIVPPNKSAHAALVARDVTFLLDTSGSMGGAPIDQAKRVVLAMLDGLSSNDRFEAIEFSMRPNRFRADLLFATAANKSAAANWLRGLQANGGTEMREGILEALRPAPERRRDGASTQVVLVTDGLIGFEQEIVGAILALLPGDARLHTVGVGSSVNRSLLGPAARAGRGIEVIIGLGEDPEQAATRLRLRSDAPIVVDVEVSGSALLQISPVKVPDLFAGAPVLLSARVRAEGGELLLRGKCEQGIWEERMHITPITDGTGSDAIATLFAREAVEDLEMQIAGGTDARECDSKIEALGLAYRISTRMTSWIAIDKSATVDPRDPTRRVTMPQALPHGMSAEGLGLRSPLAVVMRARRTPGPLGYAGPPPAARMIPPPPRAAYPQSLARPAPSAPARSGSRDERDEGVLNIPAPPPTPVDALRSQTPTSAPSSLEKKKKSETLIGRIKDAIFGEAKEASFSGKIVRGRVVVRNATELVVEFSVDDPITWSTDNVHAVLNDGASFPAHVDASRTTRAGVFTSGTTVRIALAIENGFDPNDVAAIELTLADTNLRIEIA